MAIDEFVCDRFCSKTIVDLTHPFCTFFTQYRCPTRLCQRLFFTLVYYNSTVRSICRRSCGAIFVVFIEYVSDETLRKTRSEDYLTRFARFRNLVRAIGALKNSPANVQRLNQQKNRCLVFDIQVCKILNGPAPVTFFLRWKRTRLVDYYTDFCSFFTENR